MRFSSLVVAALAALGLSSAAHAAIVTNFNGNGATGFGGPVGNGVLTVSDDGAGNITITVNPNGGNLGGNNAVLYLDTKPGGVSDTSTLTDEGDSGRRTISGVFTNNPSNGNNTTRSVVQFPAGFGADFGIAVEPNNFEGVFDVNNSPGNFTFTGGNSIPTNAPYSVTLTRTQLGLGPTDPFSIVGNEISGSMFRSNETFGATTGGGNPEFNGTLTFTDADVFSVPEPASIGLLGLAGLATLRRRRYA